MLSLMNYKKSQGFSLLEAIVALTIMATFGIAIFSWINGLLISVDKIERNYARDAITRNVAEYLSDINVMDHPNGDISLGRHQIRWSSSLVEPIKAGKSFTGSSNEFMVGLYQTDAVVSEGSLQVTKISFRLVGYRGEAKLPF